MSTKELLGLRTIIIDDHKLFATGLSSTLESIGLRIVATLTTIAMAEIGSIKHLQRSTAFFGDHLDKKNTSEIPIYTIVLSLLSIFLEAH